MSDELVLAISGNDIFSGGGLHADLATFTTNKQNGFVAITCLTAMTENGFEVIPIDSKVFKQQLDSLKDVPFSAIKIGLLPNVEIAELTLDFVKKCPEIPIVLDPVLVCKETHDVEVSQLHQEVTIDNDHVVAWSQTIDYSIHLENGFWQSIGTGEGVVNTFRGTGEIYVQSLNLQTFAGLLNRCLPKRS